MGHPKSPAIQSLIWYILLAFGFSWLVWLFPFLSSRGFFALPLPNTVWVILGAHGPLVASLFLTHRSGGWQAVGRLIRSGFNLRMNARWWLAILVGPIVLAAIAVWTNMRLNSYQPDTSLLAQPLLIPPTFLIMFFLGGSFQEEFGWRGYALPRLLKTSAPLRASIILGALWGLWHLPLFYISGVSQSFMPFGVFLLLTLAFSVLFTWFWLRTDHNLFSALLFHTAINTSLSLFPPIEQRADGNQTAFKYLMIAYFLVSVTVILLEPIFRENKSIRG